MVRFPSFGGIANVAGEDLRTGVARVGIPRISEECRETPLGRPTYESIFREHTKLLKPTLRMLGFRLAQMAWQASRIGHNSAPPFEDTLFGFVYRCGGNR